MAVTVTGYKFSAKDFLHIIPFVFAFCLTLVLYQFRPYEVKLELLKAGLFDATGSTIYFISMQVVTFTYLLIAFQLARQKNKKLKLYFSSIEKINFGWLKLVVTAFCVMWIVDIINWTTYLLRAGTTTSVELLEFISILINFIFANLLILKNLKLPQIEIERGNGNGKHKYESSTLTEQEKVQILARLENIMSNEKLYLNSSLNLGETARHLSIAPRYLSQVINELKRQNFYDYVNNYRINEAKMLLSDPNHENDKILAVQYDCGFNSKSVFNTLFKKNTGVTPSEYRKMSKIKI
jgi:AraC-like DNA-binding protein